MEKSGGLGIGDQGSPRGNQLGVSLEKAREADTELRHAGSMSLCNAFYSCGKRTLAGPRTGTEGPREELRRMKKEQETMTSHLGVCKQQQAFLGGEKQISVKAN